MAQRRLLVVVRAQVGFVSLNARSPTWLRMVITVNMNTYKVHINVCFETAFQMRPFNAPRTLTVNSRCLDRKHREKKVRNVLEV